MWEKRVLALLHKVLLHWHYCRLLCPPSPRAVPNRTLLWALVLCSPEAVQIPGPATVWASHQSGFSPHTILTTPEQNETLLSHSCVHWLSPTKLIWICASIEIDWTSPTLSIFTCWKPFHHIVPLIKKQHVFICAHHVVEDHGMSSKFRRKRSCKALAADRPSFTVRKPTAATRN